MDLSSDFDSTQRAISDALVATTRSTSRIAAEDVDFHRTSDSVVARSVQKNGSRLLALAEELLNQSSKLESRARIRLRSIEHIDANWTTVVDELDNLLERTDSTLDEYSEYFRKRKDGSRDSSPAPKRSKYLPREFRAQIIEKPQLSFLHKPFNHETPPFRPLLRTKPHALEGLAESIHITSDGGFSHPYQHEISVYDYPPRVYQVAQPIEPEPFTSTQAVFVDDMEAVHTMLDELRGVNEIAIDLEHHDTHSYIGMVSLMQISTRNKDWIIDTLKPWRRDLEVLNEVFADPTIVKVLHGAQMDAIWLQRDLGLYLVGLFDTYHASCALGYAKHSLAYLLKKFVSFDAQKQYQTADWRIRPLPSELFDYARSDTHFLLYIYDNMRNELCHISSSTHRDKTQDVLQASKDYALQRYEHPAYCTLPIRSHNGWFGHLLKSPADLSDAQLVAFRKLHEWRDKVGREEDESTNYIMPNFALLNLARSLPTNAADLLAILGTPSHVTRARADELIAIISGSLTDHKSAADIKRHLEHFHSVQVRTQTRDDESGLWSLSATELDVNTLPERFRATSSQFWGPQAKSEIPSILFADSNAFTLTFLGGSDEVPSSPHARHANELEVSRERDARGRRAHETILVPEDRQEQIVGSRFGSITSWQDSHKAKRGLNEEIKDTHGTKNDETAFNYNNEPSLIQVEHRRDSRRMKPGTQQPFDAFAKAASARGDLGRHQTSRSGRTATFRGTALK